MTAQVAPLFIRRTRQGLMLVDDQGRVVGGQLGTIVSEPGDLTKFTVEFAIGLDVEWEGEAYPDAPGLEAMFKAWASLSLVNRGRFIRALMLGDTNA
ncbi:hypothetical protein [Caulobacter phage Kronos]|uniref:Uncharacterized protein n=1 Tax=Caulobacter phage Kronos TaxID=2340873 RepID=A0A386KRP3_9CAUD|nr:hypothetical protein [Caulobacter phage Kronos]